MSSSHKIYVWRLLCVLENIYLKDEGHRSPCSCPSQLANIYFECRYLISMQKYLPCSQLSRSNCCESAAVCCCAHMRGNWVTVSPHHNTLSPVHCWVSSTLGGWRPRPRLSLAVPILCKQNNTQSHYWAHTNSRVLVSQISPAHCMQMYFAQYIRTLTMAQTQPMSPCVCGDILMSNSKLSTMQWTRHRQDTNNWCFQTGFWQYNNYIAKYCHCQPQ